MTASTTTLTAVRFVLQQASTFRFYLLGQIAVALVWAIETSLGPYLLKCILDYATLLSTQPAVWQQLIWYVSIYMIISVVLVFNSRCYSWILIQLYTPLRQQVTLFLTDRMLQHSHYLYQEHSTGNITNKIKEVAEDTPVLSTILIDRFLSYALTIVIALYTAWQVNSIFTLALSFWLLCFLLIALLCLRKADLLSKQAAECKSQVMGQVVDVISNVMNVRFFAGRQKEQQLLTQVTNRSVQASQKRDRFFANVNFIQYLFYVLFQGICMYVLTQGLRAGTVSVGDFAMIIALNSALGSSIWNFTRDLVECSDVLGVLTQGLHTIMQPHELSDQPQAQPLQISKGEIRFQEVSFCYSQSHTLFHNKSIIIAPQQKVGLVGYSGSGKSTFVNLILRLFDVTAGQILIDGQSIATVTQDSLRQAIAVIPQEPALFHRSLRDNIRYGHFNASDTEVEAAAQKAHAHTFITSMPNGYDTLAGERGTKLSGGQRQRIALARALLKNAPILILDEATSQLDSVTEQDIQTDIHSLMQNKTTLVIAHRLSTLLKMDRILVFDQGRIVEDGSHAQLLLKNGLYKTLWQTQNGGLLPHDKDLSISN